MYKKRAARGKLFFWWARPIAIFAVLIYGSVIVAWAS